MPDMKVRTAPLIGVDISRWSRTDKVAGGATLVLFVSLFLPWFEYGGQTANGLWHGFEYITLIVSLVLLAHLALRACVPTLAGGLAVSHHVVLPTATGINFLLVLVGFLARPSAFGLVIAIAANWAFGAFVSLLAASVAAAAVFGPRLRDFIGHGM
jgi:hypothetical protein